MKQHTTLQRLQYTVEKINKSIKQAKFSNSLMKVILPSTLFQLVIDAVKNLSLLVIIISCLQ